MMLQRSNIVDRLVCVCIYTKGFAYIPIETFVFNWEVRCDFRS